MAQTRITDASKHLGEIVTISDKVYNTKLIEGSKVFLLSLGGYYPNQLLTIMIPDSARSKFKKDLDDAFKGQTVRVTGKLTSYQGKPEITVIDPSQIKVLFVDPMMSETVSGN